MNKKEYIHSAKEHREALYRFALRYMDDGDLAWDMVQEALITLWEHLDEVSRSQAKGYLIRVMYRRMVDHHRREVRLRNKMPDLTIGLSESFYHHENYDLHDAMQQVLNQLEDQQRAVLLMKDLEGYHYKEIAQLFDLDEMQVAGLLYRARVNFKKLWTRNNPT